MTRSRLPNGATARGRLAKRATASSAMSARTRMVATTTKRNTRASEPWRIHHSGKSRSNGQNQGLPPDFVFWPSLHHARLFNHSDRRFTHSLKLSPFRPNAIMVRFLYISYSLERLTVPLSSLASSAIALVTAYCCATVRRGAARTFLTEPRTW